MLRKEARRDADLFLMSVGKMTSEGGDRLTCPRCPLGLAWVLVRGCLLELQRQLEELLHLFQLNPLQHANRYLKRQVS